MGLAGLVIGLGGFWLTLAQISKVKSATEAQETAIASLRFRLASFDAIQECAHAQLFLEHLREAIQTNDSNKVLDSYDKLALCLINIAESNSVKADITKELRMAADRVGKISKGIESSSVSDLPKTKHLEIARDFHGLLMRVRFEIHQEH